MTSVVEINQHINAVMETMNWPEDAFVPIANEENRKLMDRLQQLLETKDNKANHLKQLNERTELLRAHYKDAETDINQNLKLLDVHRKQCESEYHMLKLAENNQLTTAKLKLDVKKDILAIADQNVKIENDTDKLNNQIDSLGDDMQWMKSALIEWSQAIQQNEQTNNLIEKYCKDDQKKAEALEIRRLALRKTVDQNRNRLIDLETEKASAERVLERTHILYGETYAERRQMIEMWQNAVKSLNMRDRTIRESMEKIATVQGVIKAKRTELIEQTEFLNQQIRNNAESDFTISQLNAHTSQRRDQLNVCTDAIQLAANELIALKRQIQHETNQLQQIRQRNHQMMIDCDSLAKSNARIKDDVISLTEKVKKVQNEKNSSENRLQHLNELYENEERQLQEIDLEMARLSQMLFRSNQVLIEQQNEQKIVESEILMLESANKAITKNFRNQEKELARQIEIQYDTYFKTLRLECRIAKMQGKVDEVDPVLVEKHDCLQHILSATRNKREHVKNQLAAAETTERRLQNSFAKNRTDHIDLMDKLQLNQLNCETGSKSIQINREQLHDRLVEHSLLKMRVHQIAEMLNKQMAKFYDLEKHKFQLQLAIDERMVDLKCQTDILTMKRKHLWSERDLLKADINERNGKISALRARFELTKELLGKNDDGSIVSAIQLKMETAQEKALLLDQGSKLNEKVLKAEKDIKALENTLILLNYSNDKYKRKMGQAKDDEECNEQFQKLCNNYANALSRLKEANANFEIQSKKYQDLKQQHEEYERELDDIVRNRFENNDVLIKVHKEILEQNSKVERAKREAKLAKKAMTRGIGDRDYVRLLEKDIFSKELETRNSSALRQLAHLIENVSMMTLTATKLLYEKGLEIPLNNQQVSSTIGRNRSRASIRSSGRNSECSFTLNSQDNGIHSRLSERTFSSSSSKTTGSTSNMTKSERTHVSKTETIAQFQIQGQSIGSEKSLNLSK